MRKLITLLFCGCAAAGLQAQQLPNYSHYPSLLFMSNPAYTGTKSTIDFRLNYRRQWVGFDDAPIEQTVALSSRFWKGKIGAGGMMYKDETGPTRRFMYGFTSAYHLRFPDVELSAGLGIQFNKYTFNSSLLTTHNNQDPAINSTVNDVDKIINASGGILLYNDRFHFGLGVQNIPDSHLEFYQDDPTHKAVVNYKQHYYFNVGYNFRYHPDFTWENNMLVNYVIGAPMLIEYNLRVHYREKLMFGGALRLKDSVIPQVGYVYKNRIQLIYSYDFTISRMRSFNSGTHEITLGYRENFGRDKNAYRNFKDFQRQKFHLF
jgi:type IX secretion system PorP/SprF family membrane protein